MVEGLRIRRVREEDVPVLGRLFRHVYTVTDVGEEWSLEAAEDLMAYFYRVQPDLCFLAELEGEIVGAFLGKIKPWCDGNRLTESEIFVSPEHQKKGIGRELAKTMYRAAIKQHQAKVFETFTFKKRKHPLSWYKKQGFKEEHNWVIIYADLEKALKFLEEEG